jgi:hypothetical protein
MKYLSLSLTFAAVSVLVNGGTVEVRRNKNNNNNNNNNNNGGGGGGGGNSDPQTSLSEWLYLRITCAGLTGSLVQRSTLP